MRGSRRRRAARYVDAIVADARAEQTWQAWEADLEILSAIADDDPARRFLHSTSIGLDDRLLAVQRAAGDAVSVRGLGLLRLLAEQREIDLTQEIARRFRVAADEAQHVDRVHVTTAALLEEAELRDLRDRLTAPGRTLRLTTDIDPALLGGFVVRRGDDVLDLSVHARLQALASTLR
jgi:F-type H+-transporting ATPase subunit delta